MLTEYAILAILLWHALVNLSWKSSISLTISLLGCAIFAASDEFHQSFVPSRTSSVYDVMIDICGAVIGLAICIALASRKVVKEQRV